MNAYDMVPTISYIAERVMLIRYLIRDYQRTGKIRTQYQTDAAPEPSDDTQSCNANSEGPDEATIIEMQRKKIIYAFNKYKNQKKIKSRELSQALVCPRDLFIAGRVLHFIGSTLYEVSVHDISEAIFTIPTMIDHTGYYSMYKHINETLLSKTK